mgnify:FL=1
MEMTRRSFVTTAAATAGTAALAAVPRMSSAEEAAEKAAAIGKHTWEVAPDPITDVSETRDYDVVIIGAGIAGLSAAEAASRAGASVAVLERTDQFQMRGVDVGHLGSKWHQENSDPEAVPTPAMARKLLHLWSHQTTNPNLIDVWASHSGQVFDHIEEICAEQGVHMVHALSGTAKYGWYKLPERWRIYEDAVSFVRGDEVGTARPDGRECNYNLGEVLYNAATNNGAEFVFEMHAEQLVGNAADGITGVIANDAGGNYIQFNAAKGVILATGDICGNQEMIDAFAPICNRPDANIYGPAGGNTGDAILMTCWAGGTFSKSPAAPMVHQFTISSYSFNLTAFIMCWLAVNENGERYGAELPFEPYLTNARMNTPHNRAWSIFDADYAKYVEQQWPTKYETWLDGIEDEMEKRLESGELVKADTIEELAEKLGIPADKFAATVEHYNSLYDAGEDSDYDVPAQFLSRIQTAPFYATPLVCSVLTIPFGIHVNDDSQACTAEDEPIAGLYAVGNAQGDFFGVDYPVHCPGISHGRSVTFGQLVGEAVGKGITLTELLA